MPKFDLAPLPNDLTPVMPAGPAKPKNRQEAEKKYEQQYGPTGQVLNALSSPDLLSGMGVGPVNAMSKFTNALGDWLQRKPIDTSDAWQVSPETARRFNPARYGMAALAPGFMSANVLQQTARLHRALSTGQSITANTITGADQSVTAADPAAFEFGAVLGAEGIGAAVGVGILGKVKHVARLKQVTDNIRRSQLARQALVATQSGATRKALSVGKGVGEALVSTTLAAPFIDQEGDNLANLGDAFGLRLPGRREEGDNYLQSFAKGIAVEGIAAPLAALGAGALVPPIRRGMVSSDLGWLDDLANAELAPYMPRGLSQPALPPAKAQLPPGTPGGAIVPSGTPGGEIVPYDSAITRSLQEQTQLRQVTQQRQRLQDMGLVQQGQGGQLELSLDGAVDPEVRMQIRQQQAQRGQVIKRGIDSGQDVSQELAVIDQQINDLVMVGRGEDAMPGPIYDQPDLDLPDGRPELDTFLAQLDELDDRQLRGVHSRVRREIGDERNAAELKGAQDAVVSVTAKIEEIKARVESGDLTPVGGKRLLTKAQKELDQAQDVITRAETRGAQPEALVGDQLALELPIQQSLDLSQEVYVPEVKKVMKTGAERSPYGYPSEQSYRDDLGGWSRDLLRRMASPTNSPEVAAILKARTGRRVWQAKKQDIIDALVEYANRSDRWLPETPEQLADELEQLGLDLKTNPFGSDTPLFDQPADLAVPNMGKIVDADGNEVTVPVGQYQPRGLDGETRERLKKEILEQAIRNGEVQPPVTPTPARPQTTFNQGTLIDDLLADESGQLPMLFSLDAVPTYKASGKNADALIEEMRMRYEYNVLDSEAQRLQREGFLEANGWDELSWEDKKKLGFLSEGFYSLQNLTPETVRPATPQFTPELTPQAPRKPQQYAWTPEGVQPESVVKVQRAEAAKTKGVTDSAVGPVTVEQKRAAQRAVSEVQSQRAALAKRREQLIKQQKGASC